MQHKLCCVVLVQPWQPVRVLRLVLTPPLHLGVQVVGSSSTRVQQQQQQQQQLETLVYDSAVVLAVSDAAAVREVTQLWADMCSTEPESKHGGSGTMMADAGAGSAPAAIKDVMQAQAAVLQLHFQPLGV